MEKNDAKQLITRDFLPEAVILADGDFPSCPAALAVLHNAPFVACCDGAVDTYVAHGGTPQLIVGDGDSISEGNRNRFADILIKVDEQETNDLTKTVKQLLQRQFSRIAIVGATGKREDHTLGNISLLMEYRAMGVDVRMYTDHGIFVPVEGACECQSFSRQQVSIFNFGATDFTSHGLAYPIYDFTSWWQGTLNQSTGNTFSITATGKYILFLTHQAK